MSGHDESLDFDRLKARVSVGEVLSAYGLDAGLVRRGARLRGCCPLHGGDNPTAFSVDDERPFLPVPSQSLWADIDPGGDTGGKLCCRNVSLGVVES